MLPHRTGPAIVLHSMATGLLAGSAMLLLYWLEPSWPLFASVATLSLSLSFVGFTRKETDHFCKWKVAVATMASFGIFAFALIGKYRVPTWDIYHAAVAWLLAAAILSASSRLDLEIPKGMLRFLSLVWGWLGTALCLGTSYLQNQMAGFCLGILVGVLLLILGKSSFRLSTIGIQIVNTLIVLFVGLPLVDLFIYRADYFDQPPAPGERAYSYAVATKNPAIFSRWWQAYQQEETKLFRDLYLVNTMGVPALRPNSQTTFFRSCISINSKGFRGGEISQRKGSAYRIVALGESTTFGLTMNPEDKPWPQILEQLIQERIKPNRPVEVINAGIPGNNLKENVSRLRKDILALQPDMVISYHGANGFRFLWEGLPPVRGKTPPLYKQRPLKLLADCEYRLTVRDYRKGHFTKSVPQAKFSNPMENEYAQAYEELIQIVRTNGIQLVLTTYSMAVNDQSDPAVIEFYGEVFPAVRWQIKANAVHSTIVRQLAQHHADICLVDTQPAIDGHHEEFIDIMHFAPVGEQTMAETIFSGIEPLLKTQFQNEKFQRAGEK